MRLTRKIIAEFVGIFLMGGVAGGLLTWSFLTWSTDTQLTTFMSRTNNPDALVDRINKKYAEEYHLTPGEMNRIQPLVKEMTLNTYEVRHKFGVDIIATLDKYHQQIAAQMTPEHRAAYEKAVADRKLKLAGMLLDQSSPDQGEK